MLRNYFITAVRFLSKNRLFTLINTMGLAVSISCTIVIYLYIKNELTYDEFHQDVERLYILGEGSREGSAEEAAYYQTVYPALPAMLEEFPEIETGTRYFDWDGHILISGEKKFMYQVYYVDSTFLETLSFPLIAGDPETALKKEDGVVISEEIARKLFNTTDVIGQTIELENKKHYTVSGVLAKVPANSSIRPEVLFSLVEKEEDAEFRGIANWYNTIAQVIIKLRPNADPNVLRAKFPNFVTQHYDPVAKTRQLKIYPLSDLRQSEANNETYIYGLTSIGIFILLVAIINFMNLSIASSLKRLRETGMRKLMGSSKRSVVLQFFLEATLLTMIAIVISLGIVQLLLPILNQVLEMSLSLSWENILETGTLSLILAIVIGVVAGGYPALYLSGYNTVNAVKGIIPNYRGKVTLRNFLVVVQFVVSVAMIIGVTVVSRQIRYMKTADLKFNCENVIVVNMDAGFKDEKASRASLAGILNEARGRADVLSVSLSQNVPGRYSGNYNRFNKENGTDGISLRKAYVDDRYLETYGIRVLEGRNFSTAFADSSNAVMLNAAAVKALGWESAVGKTLTENGDNHAYTVVGVFDDFHYRSLDGSVEPLVHFYFNKPEYANLISVRTAPKKEAAVLSFLSAQWKTLDSWLGFNYFFLDDEFNAQYKPIERTLLLIAIFTGVAIVISCAGIFALSAIVAQQRTKEIGIRKVLGASIPGIVRLLSVDFIKLVLIAVVFASPLAWFGMSRWLNDFAYKTELDWWMFALAGCVAVLVAFATTGVQSIRAALNNPAQSLHND